MPKNDDLNKIREAARRARNAEQAAGSVPAQPDRGEFPPPSPAPVVGRASVTRPTPPPRYRPQPAYDVDVFAGSGGFLQRRAHSALWSAALSIITVWTAGVVRATHWETSYVPSHGEAVGRAVGSHNAPLLAALLVAAIGGTLILGQLGVWAGGIVAAVAGAAPAAISDAIRSWSAEWTPDALTDAFATVGALPGEYLRWVAFLLCPFLVLVCLVRAANDD